MLIMKRQTFWAGGLLAITLSAGAETLYNGIQLPSVWPPRDLTVQSPKRLPVPYLEAANIPKTIPIDIGRQLFVDDFLIASTDGVMRVWHHPRKYEGNPVLKPETPWELNTPGNAIALPKGGGLWWDSHAKIFRLWYEAGWCREICYAWSKDGIRWERPSLDIVAGSNRLLPNQKVDSWSVFPEPNPKDGQTRWNLYIMPGGESLPGHAYTSTDGIHWVDRGETSLAGDRSNMFYNPFRRKWVWSLRASWRGRSTIYHEADDFIAGSAWHWPFGYRQVSWGKNHIHYTNTVDCSLWLAADDLDVQTTRPDENQRAQLYAMNAVGYESLMLGAFEIHWGPENDKCMKRGLPKITEIQFAYSRDGFHFARPDRTAAIAAERWGAYGQKWDVGYVQPLSNLCVIQGDELWFYYGAFGGDATRLTADAPNIPHSGNGNLNGIYAHGATGVAFLRRDGFCGLKATARGTVTTRPLVFTGKELFVNLDAPKGTLETEVLDAETQDVLAKLPPVTCDATKRAVGGVAAFAGRRVRFRFTLANAELYAFWVAPDARGCSRGFLAGGGPAYTGLRDE